MALVGPELSGALRGLRRSPAFTLTTILTFALASGSVLAVLAVANSLLLRPLPVVDQGQVAIAWKADHQAGFPHFPFTYQAAQALRDQVPSASDVATIDYNGAWPLSITDGDQGLKLFVGMVSGRFFPLLGVRPVVGRLFEASDDVVGGRRVIVIGERYWRDRYRSDPAAIGKTIVVYGNPHEIIGVVPGDFRYPRGAMAWIPMFTWQGEWLNNPDAVTQDLVFRLKPGRTIEQLRSELETARSRTPAEQRREYANQRVVVFPWADEVLGDLGAQILLIGVGALGVLIVASANAGGLLMVRSGERLHEIAVRRALGSGRWRALGAILLEHGLLVAIGIGTGAGLARVALEAFLYGVTPTDPTALVVVAAVLIAVAAAALAIPIGRAVRTEPAEALRAD